MRLVFAAAALGFPSAQDIAQAIINAIGGALMNLLGNASVQNILAPFAPLVLLMTTTDPATSYANQVVMGTWTIMAIVANALLVLVVISGGLQMMIGQTTGVAYTPAREFIPKILAGAIGINVSLFLGRILIDLNNGLCALVQFDMFGFINQIGVGHTQNQNTLLLFALSTVFAIVFMILIFQTVGRIALIDLLLVLAPLWILLLLLPQTQQFGEYGGRLLAATTFTQAIQVIALSLGAKFLASTGLHDPVSMLVLGAGMMMTVGSIPRLLSRLTVPGGTSGSGSLAGVFSMAARAAVFLAA